MTAFSDLVAYGNQAIYFDSDDVPLSYPEEVTIDPEIINEMLRHYYGEDIVVLLMYFRRKTHSPILARRILLEAIECVEDTPNWPYNQRHVYYTCTRNDIHKHRYYTLTRNGHYHGIFVEKWTFGEKVLPIVRATYNCFTNKGSVIDYYNDTGEFEKCDTTEIKDARVLFRTYLGNSWRNTRLEAVKHGHQMIYIDGVVRQVYYDNGQEITKSWFPQIPGPCSIS